MNKEEIISKYYDPAVGMVVFKLLAKMLKRRMVPSQLKDVQDWFTKNM
jgi:hypothetical protein